MLWPNWCRKSSIKVAKATPSCFFVFSLSWSREYFFCNDLRIFSFCRSEIKGYTRVKPFSYWTFPSAFLRCVFGSTLKICLPFLLHIYIQIWFLNVWFFYVKKILINVTYPTKLDISWIQRTLLEFIDVSWLA